MPSLQDELKRLKEAEDAKKRKIQQEADLAREKQITYKFGDTAFLIDQIQHLYSNPRTAFREYITNSIDNKFPDKTLDVRILVSKSDNRILIRDNGSGMNIEDLARIPEQIGLSEKRGIESARGEKGFGLLAYPSCGASQCSVLTRKYDSNEELINFLDMVKGKPSAYVDQLLPEDVKLKVPKVPLETFEHGTFIILNGISEEVIERYFTPSSIRDLVSFTFAPLLREGMIEVTVGYSGKGQKAFSVEAPEYKGKSVLDETIEVKYTKDGQQKI